MHWYCTTTGEPRYEIDYASGKPGKTPTLADAKKQGFVPSVTSVLGILDKPGLNVWKQNQSILAALTNPDINTTMSHEEMLKIIKIDAAEHAKVAAQRGTDIHGQIELGVRGLLCSDEYRPMVLAAIDCLNDISPDDGWIPEAHLPGGLGYGGKVDVHSDKWVIDFKTKEFTSEDVSAKKVKGWPEQHCQLVAYSHGLGGGHRLANVFVSVTEPGLCHVYEWPEDEYDIGLRRWFATLETWLAWKDPRNQLAQGND